MLWFEKATSNTSKLPALTATNLVYAFVPAVHKFTNVNVSNKLCTFAQFDKERNKMLMFFLFATVLATEVTRGEDACISRSFGSDSIVCVCNATYCDKPPIPMSLDSGKFYHYTSSKAGLRMQMTDGQMRQEPSSGIILTLDRTKTYQTILGFGGAFTDSAGLNINKLSDEAQEKLIKSYFGTDGSKYSFGRIPIAGSDFSTRAYTYDDVVNDTDLSHFRLADEDFNYKIPYIKKALQLNPDLKLFAAAWSAPPWMKTNDDYTGFGFLKKDYYQLYAEYLKKYLEEYKKHGIVHWAISTGNEPLNVYVPFFKINSLGWTPQTVATWVAENLGPTLEQSEFNQTLILTVDDQRFEVPWFVDKMFKNKKAKDYVDGIALHWYWDKLFSVERLEEVHRKYPDKFLLMTEACTGNKPNAGKTVDLGSWTRGDDYASNIIQNLLHWHTGWVDWNIALDMDGGPNWVDNNVDSPIIVNAENDEFYKQPMYYALMHFSRFIPPGSLRLAIDDAPAIGSIAFHTPDHIIVIVLHNRNDITKEVVVKDQGGNVPLVLQPNSINTIVYAM